ADISAAETALEDIKTGLMEESFGDRDVINGYFPLNYLERTASAAELLALEVLTLNAFENEKAFILELYDLALGREPTSGEMEEALGELLGYAETGRERRERLAQRIFSSAEVENRGLDDYAFMAALHRTFTGMTPVYNDIIDFVNSIGAGYLTRAEAAETYADILIARDMAAMDSRGLADIEFVEAAFDALVQGEHSTTVMSTIADSITAGDFTREEVIWLLAGVDDPSDSGSLYYTLINWPSPGILDSGWKLLSDGYADIERPLVEISEFASRISSIWEGELEGEEALDPAKYAAAARNILSLLADRAALEMSLAETVAGAYFDGDEIKDEVRAAVERVDSSLALVEELYPSGDADVSAAADIAGMRSIFRMSESMLETLETTAHSYDPGEYEKLAAAIKGLGDAGSEYGLYKVIEVSASTDEEVSAEAKELAGVLYTAIRGTTVHARETLADAEIALHIGGDKVERAEASRLIASNIALSIDLSESARDASALSRIASGLVAAIEEDAAKILEAAAEYEDTDQLMAVNAALLDMAAAAKESSNACNQSAAGIVRAETDVISIRDKTASMRQAALDISDAISSSETLDETKALLGALSNIFSGLVEFKGKMDLSVVKYPNNKVLLEEIKAISGVTEDMVRKIREAERKVAVEEAVETLGASLKEEIAEKAGIIARVNEIMGQFSEEDTAVHEILYGMARDLLAEIEDSRENLSLAEMSLQGDPTMAANVSAARDAYDLIAMPAMEEIFAAYRRNLAATTEGASLVGQTGALKGAIEKARDMAEMSSDAGFVWQLYEAADTLAAELAEVNAFAQAMTASGYTSQVWLDNAMIAAANDDVADDMTLLVTRASELKLAELETLSGSYREILSGMVSETEVSTPAEARGMLLTAETVISRLYEIAADAADFASKASDSAVVKARQEGIKVQIRLAESYFDSIRRKAFERQAFETSLAWSIERLTVLRDTVRAVTDTISGLSLLTEADLRELLAMRAMVTEARREADAIISASLYVKNANPENSTMEQNYSVVASFSAVMTQELSEVDTAIGVVVTLLDSSPEGLDFAAIASDRADLSERTSVIASSLGGVTAPEAECAAGLVLASQKTMLREEALAGSVFSDGFEYGSSRVWNGIQLNDGSLGVTASPLAGGLFDGQYVLELRGASSYALKDLGDLRDKGTVTISFYGAVSSLDYNYYNPEHMDMDFFDGTTWRNSVVRIDRDKNDQGYVLYSWTVPAEYLSGNNKIRFSARASGNGDYFYVDGVTVSCDENGRLSSAENIREAMTDSSVVFTEASRERITQDAALDHESLMTLAAELNKSVEAAFARASGTVDTDTLLTLSDLMEGSASRIMALKTIAETLEFDEGDISALASYCSSAAARVDTLFADLAASRTSFNSISASAQLYGQGKALEAVKEMMSMPGSSAELKGLIAISEELSAMTRNSHYEALLAAAADPDSAALEALRAFAGGMAEDNLLCAISAGKEAAKILDIMDANASLLEGSEAVLDTLEALNIMSGAATSAVEANDYGYMTDAAEKYFDTSRARASEAFGSMPASETARTNTIAIDALEAEVREAAAGCRTVIGSAWSSVVTLASSGEGLIVSDDEGILTINVTVPGGRLVELRFKDRRLVSVTDVTAGITTQVNSRNTEFSIGADGTSEWRVIAGDGRIFVVKDRYTGVATVPSGAEVLPEWSWKIMEYVSTADFSALEEPGLTSSFRDFLSVTGVMSAVKGFFDNVVEAYGYSLKTVLLPEEKTIVEYYMPFIQSLLAANPMILISGGIGAMGSWIVSQGVYVTSCAVQSLLGYFEAGSVEADKERITAETLITDVLKGIVTPYSSGRLETSLFALKSAAAARGVDLKAVKTSADKLAAKTMPAIAVLEEAFG
ncbi:MAG: hypothetical protein PHT95_03400, partial [Candidatus Omnitrophica bacterium]|nr:hypothetical protein [Candidatus Omnitrophota bacterium]